jgi:hypothetical protein
VAVPTLTRLERLDSSRVKNVHMLRDPWIEGR